MSPIPSPGGWGPFPGRPPPPQRTFVPSVRVSLWLQGIAAPELLPLLSHHLGPLSSHLTLRSQLRPPLPDQLAPAPGPGEVTDTRPGAHRAQRRTLGVPRSAVRDPRPPGGARSSAGSRGPVEEWKELPRRQACVPSWLPIPSSRQQDPRPRQGPLAHHSRPPTEFPPSLPVASAPGRARPDPVPPTGLGCLTDPPPAQPLLTSRPPSLPSSVQTPECFHQGRGPTITRPRPHPPFCTSPLASAHPLCPSDTWAGGRPIAANTSSTRLQ